MLSNSIYVAEMALATLLALRPTRRVAVVAVSVFIILTEVVAREFLFGALFLNLILMFVRTDLNQRMIKLFAASLACLMLIRIGLLPEITFH